MFKINPIFAQKIQEVDFYITVNGKKNGFDYCN